MYVTQRDLCLISQVFVTNLVCLIVNSNKRRFKMFLTFSERSQELDFDGIKYNNALWISFLTFLFTVFTHSEVWRILAQLSDFEILFDSCFYFIEYKSNLFEAKLYNTLKHPATKQKFLR